MRFDDTRTEWRINDVERKAEQAVSRLYELDSLRSSMDSLERTNRELSSICNELRSELQELQEEVRRMNELITESGNE